MEKVWKFIDGHNFQSIYMFLIKMNPVDESTKLVKQSIQGSQDV